MANNIDKPDAPATALAAFAASAGEFRTSAMNEPIDLSEADSVWFVDSGMLDVAVAEYGEAGIASSFKHLFQVQPGRLVFGLPMTSGLKLVAKGLPGTRLRKLRASDLPAAAEAGDGAELAAELAAQADRWIEDFAAAVARDFTPRPRPAANLSSRGNPPPPAPGVVFAEHGVVWLTGDGLDASYLQLEDPLPDGPRLMPVTRDAWVGLRRTEGVSCVASGDFEIGFLLRRALPEFHRLALGAEGLNRQLLLADAANLQRARFTRRRLDEQAARRALAELGGTPRQRRETENPPLAAALELIGRHEGFTVRKPPPIEGEEREPALREYLKESGLRARAVRLVNEDQWWRGDSGAMLAFRRDGGEPVAMLPGAGGSYRIIDPSSGRSRRAGAATGAELRAEAWLVYRTLPAGGPVSMRQLFALGGGNSGTDLARLALAGVCAGALALAPAAGLNILVGSVIPSGGVGALLQFSAALAGISVVALLAHMLRGTALMRLEGRIVSRLSTAVWDRLLRLEVAVYRKFTTGDITTRSMTFQTLRDQVSGTAAEALLSALFLLPMFGLVFYYDATFGWLMLGLGLAILALTATLARKLIEPQRRHFSLERRLSGDLLQFIGSVVKLRLLGAEGSAFAAWARRFREQKLAEIRISMLAEHIAAFGAAVPALGSAAIFAAALLRDGGPLAPADFVAIYAASLAFFMAATSVGQSLQAAVSMIPGCEQVAPILRAGTDAPPRRGVQPSLEGEIAMHRVSFRYDKDGPKVLDDISFRAGPGEFIGIVGDSGGGKSTLFRIAMGLEKPESGTVYYDGKELANLDLEAVRRQLGVVTQDGGLQGGTLVDNIIGVDVNLDIEDAWRAARKAAVHRDIEAMPMGMHTPVSEGGSTFSGGQRQRIRIAAALVHDPRILFLDEPTSWLDNRSQSETMRGIRDSVATRIVIAHRLSTIREADRIYVIRGGRVAQVGSFDELMGVEGPFRELARRQIS